MKVVVVVVVVVRIAILKVASDNSLTRQVAEFLQRLGLEPGRARKAADAE